MFIDSLYPANGPVPLSHTLGKILPLRARNANKKSRIYRFLWKKWSPCLCRTRHRRRAGTRLGISIWRMLFRRPPF